MPDEKRTKETSISAEGSAAGERRQRQRTVVPCDFRTAGRLSNENARALTAIHDTFARRLATALDAWLGTAVGVKQTSLTQLPIHEHIANLPAITYIVPFSFSNIQSTVIVECDVNLAFPIIELLLGGKGSQGSEGRELSEIEEEIMQDVTSLIARQAEAAWRLSNGSLVAGRRIKSSLLQQYFQVNEKVTLVRFEVQLAAASGSFQLAFPGVFLNALIQQIREGEPNRKSSVRYFSRPSLRERILDCDIEVAAELPGLRVAVRDLVSLEEGSVLKLRAPVRAPGMLTAGGHGIFEAVPVRNGSQKAAQLGRRAASVNWERE